VKSLCAADLVFTVACGGSHEAGEEGIEVLLSEIREIEDTL
jgi:hypothetical protein